MQCWCRHITDFILIVTHFLHQINTGGHLTALSAPESLFLLFHFLKVLFGEVCPVHRPGTFTFGLEFVSPNSPTIY